MFDSFLKIGNNFSGLEITKKTREAFVLKNTHLPKQTHSTFRFTAIIAKVSFIHVECVQFQNKNCMNTMNRSLCRAK